MNGGGGGTGEVEATLHLYSSGNDPGIANDPIQMICYSTATDHIPPQIVPLKIYNWNGMDYGLDTGMT